MPHPTKENYNVSKPSSVLTREIESTKHTRRVFSSSLGKRMSMRRMVDHPIEGSLELVADHAREALWKSCDGGQEFQLVNGRKSTIGFCERVRVIVSAAVMKPETKFAWMQPVAVVIERLVGHRWANDGRRIRVRNM
jgi:hypothetical protein